MTDITGVTEEMNVLIAVKENVLENAETGAAMNVAVTTETAEAFR